MARTRIVIHDKAVQQLVHSEAAQADLMRRAERIAQACNDESSWGGYETSGELDGEGPEARVYSIDQQSSSERANRIIRNLDAGR